MKISAIVAVSKGNVIGKDNGIPWYLPADFKYFKKVSFVINVFGLFSESSMLYLL